MAGAISRSIADITNACVRVTSCPQSATLARNLAMYHDTLTGPIAVHKTVPVSRVSDGLKRHPCRFDADNAKICSRHFTDDCFKHGPSGTRRTLILGSLPTLWMPSKSVETPETTRQEPRATARV
ncbi:hypothetical protein LSAT2_004061 [Lamellibrachia satsuma]|nr:hypothetical protein LSAT2_004061 [Lamellibrachia satsuma]